MQLVIIMHVLYALHNPIDRWLMLVGMRREHGTGHERVIVDNDPQNQVYPMEPDHETI
jgi:hypothetical protein